MTTVSNIEATTGIARTKKIAGALNITAIPNPQWTSGSVDNSDAAIKPASREKVQSGEDSCKLHSS